MGLGDLKTLTAETEKPAFDLLESKPDNTDLDLGPAPRNVYPVVFCCMAEENQGMNIAHIAHLSLNMQSKTKKLYVKL